MAASNLTLRLATAGVLIPIILALLFWGPAWGWLVFLLLVAITGGVEFFGMTHPGDRLAQVLGTGLVWAVVLAMWFFQDHPKVLLSVLLLLPFAAFSVWVCAQSALNSIGVWEQSPDPSGLPRWPLKAIVPVAFALLAAQSLSEIVKRVALIRGANPWNLGLAPNAPELETPPAKEGER